jgi:23S rRNA (uracil1939-C5)-methyltransferase
VARVRAIEATIGSLAPGGDGVAHVSIDEERRAVFVAQTAPGDTARVEVDLAHRPARGRVLELLSPGADRVEAPCAWSVRCGGCDWMHLSTTAQAQWHREHVRAALPAEWRDIAITTHAAPESLHQRTRARVHVRIERGRPIVGMHEAGTHDPVEVDSCVVLHPALETARRSLAGLLEGSRGRGEVQLALGSPNEGDPRPVLEVSWRGDLAAACFARLDAATRDGRLAGASVTLQDATRPAIVGDPTPWMTGADGEPLRLAPGGFGQATERVNALLARHVAELAAHDAAAGKWLELYAGAGNLTVLLARVQADAYPRRELLAVESSGAACAAARTNLAARSLHARVVEADADSYAWSPMTRLVVLDPPRTGARPVVERLALSRVSRVVYVSCNPATLGRDLALLAPAYDLRSVAAFEMFPYTSHVEVVADLTRRRP